LLKKKKKTKRRGRLHEERNEPIKRLKLPDESEGMLRGERL